MSVAKREHPSRMLKKAVQQGRSERRGESYFVSYVEPLGEARTTPGERRVSARGVGRVRKATFSASC